MKVTSIAISGLFDRFDHVIAFEPNEPIRIMIAPNGFGKTMILRLINMIFNQPVRRLARMPFHRLDIATDQGTGIAVVRTVGNADAKKGADLTLVRTDAKGVEESFKPQPRIRSSELSFPVGIIEDVIPELDQIGPSTWRHRGTGETLSLDDVLENYEEQLPSNEDDTSKGTGLPPWLKEIRKAIPVRFISAERLTYSASYRDQINRFHRVGRSESPKRTVTRYSQELSGQVSRTLSEYGSLAQSLDRTFPGRLVAEPPRSGLPMEPLQRELAEVETKRAKLIEAGLLQQEFSPWGEWGSGLDIAKVDESKRAVLSVYARDASKKLSVFDDLYTRIELLTRIINSRLLDKKVKVSDKGLEVLPTSGNKLSLEMLSSGEQHELVLLYDLLFRIPNNSLILIDEPELSFHVAWQAAFLGDLQEIAKISQFQALLATHSPQVIGDRWDLTTELKGPTDR